MDLTTVNTLKWLLLGLLLSSGVYASDAPDPDPTFRDWEHAGTLAEARKLPVVIVFVADHCGYCERLEETFLAPLKEKGSLEERAIVHTLDIHASGKVKDFDGERMRITPFVNRYGVFATPTIVMVDPQGRMLGEPLVGFNEPETYGDLFHSALADALTILKAPQSSSYVAHDD